MGAWVGRDIRDEIVGFVERYAAVTGLAAGRLVACIRPKTPLSDEDARRITAGFVDHYNNVRLHGAIGYIAPRDQLEGRGETIQAERRCKLHQAHERRKARFQSQGARTGDAAPRPLTFSLGLTDHTIGR